MAGTSVVPTVTPPVPVATPIALGELPTSASNMQLSANPGVVPLPGTLAKPAMHLGAAVAPLKYPMERQTLPWAASPCNLFLEIDDTALQKLLLEEKSCLETLDLQSKQILQANSHKQQANGPLPLMGTYVQSLKDILVVEQQAQAAKVLAKNAQDRLVNSSQALRDLAEARHQELQKLGGTCTLLQQVEQTNAELRYDIAMAQHRLARLKHDKERVSVEHQAVVNAARTWARFEEKRAALLEREVVRLEEEMRWCQLMSGANQQ